LDAHAAEVAGAVLEAAHRYTDKKLERAAVVFASKAAKRSSLFAKALASEVVKQASGRPAQQMGKREMFTVLALIRVIVGSLDPDTAKKALTKLLEVQVKLVDAVMVLSLPWRVRTCATIVGVLTVHALAQLVELQGSNSYTSSTHLNSCSLALVFLSPKN
jgi:hypothetical protein